MPKTWNKRDPLTPPEAVYVGRPSPWGNPFEIGKHGTRDEVIQKYREMVYHPSTFWDVKRHQIKLALKGKDLVCWCAPKPCHADILLEIANEESS